jgi:hypothetical protein
MANESSGNGQHVIEVPISSLLLDTRNPRFAGELGASPTQRQIVNYISETIGVADLLSSMSRAGYHRSHPLIGIREGGSFIVVEGNRRLVAALILTNDERAVDQRQRARNYPLATHVQAKLETLPVLVAQDRKEVLPYLGIAHIVGNKKWDSYAKAAWAADVIDSDIFEGGVREVADQIGDKHRTLERLLEAFRLVKQLESKVLFLPDDTIKKGKGTAKFPFSWVYTVLGYQSVREWLGVNQAGSGEKGAGLEFVPSSCLERAAELLLWMFGSRSKPQDPLIEESRQIADLAAALASNRQVALLRRGYDIAKVKKEVQPPYERITDGLLVAEESLKGVLGILGSSRKEIPEAQISYLAAEARRVANAALSVYRQINELNEPGYDEQLSQ